MILSEYTKTFEPIPISTSLLADNLHGCDFENNQKIRLSNSKLISENHALFFVNNNPQIENRTPNITNCLISTNSKRKKSFVGCIK